MAIVEAALRKRLEGMDGSPVDLVERTRVTGRFAEQFLRDCEVLIFALSDDHEARGCYALEAGGRVKMVERAASDRTTAAMTRAVISAMATNSRRNSLATRNP